MPNPSAAATKAGSSTSLPRVFWLYWTVLFLVAAVEWCVAYWGADFLSTVVGLSEATAATAMSIFFTAMVAGRFVGARLTRRYDSSTLLVGALLLALVGFPIFWLFSTPGINLLGLFIAGIGIANFYPLSIGVATDVAPMAPDRATARLAIAGSTSLLLAPLIVGTISDLVGMRWGFGLVVPFIVAAIAVTLRARAERSSVSASIALA